MMGGTKISVSNWLHNIIHQPPLKMLQQHLSFKWWLLNKFPIALQSNPLIPQETAALCPVCDSVLFHRPHSFELHQERFKRGTFCTVLLICLWVFYFKKWPDSQMPFLCLTWSALCGLMRLGISTDSLAFNPQSTRRMVLGSTTFCYTPVLFSEM